MKRAAMWVAGIAVALLVAWGALHVLISPVNPDQEPPDEHIGSACWGCHLVLPSAELR